MLNEATVRKGIWQEEDDDAVRKIASLKLCADEVFFSCEISVKHYLLKYLVFSLHLTHVNVE